MKLSKLTIVLFMVLLPLVGCKSTAPISYFPSAELGYVNAEGDLLTLRVLGYGVSEQEAINNAKISGFDHLFFRGVPNSPYNNPLIGVDEKGIKTKFNSYFEMFYEDKGMLNFVSNYRLISSDEATVLAKKIKSRKTVLTDVKSIAAYIEMTINVKGVRKDLENKNVIRAFGF